MENNTNKKPARAKWRFSAMRITAFVCLLGAFSQLMLSSKIIFADKEFATLALSLVFFILFGYGYYLCEKDLPYKKNDYMFDSFSLLAVSLFCGILMVIFLDKKGEIAVAAICSASCSQFLPLSMFLLKKWKSGKPNEK